jgi:hypothetical protein
MGDGTFVGSRFVQAGTGNFGQGGVTGGFNGDGRQDVVAFSQDIIYVLLGDTQPGFQMSASELSPATVTAGNSGTSRSQSGMSP